MRVVIGGGGTVGHLSPGLALAKVLSSQGADIMFIGSATGPEAEIVPSRGFRFEPVRVSGRGAGALTVRNAVAVARLGRALLRTLNLLRRFRPNVVVATGGYVSLPVSMAARLMRVPLVIHEQNSVPGLANRVAARWAKVVAVSFPNTKVPEGATVVNTGNPVREDITDLDRAAHRPAAIEHFELGQDRRTLLITGGSQGALNINNAAFACYERWRRRSDIQVLHLVGPAKAEECLARIGQLRSPDDTIRWNVVGYTERMNLAYAAADLAVSRAGASTIAELAAAQLPAIMVPLPVALDDDQRHNALAIEAMGGGLMILDRDLADRLCEEVERLILDATRLGEMATAIARFSRPDAAERLAELVLEADRQSRLP